MAMIRHRIEMLWTHQLGDLEKEVNAFLDTMVGRDMTVKDIKFQAEPETRGYDTGYSAMVWYIYADDGEEERIV